MVKTKKTTNNWKTNNQLMAFGLLDLLTKSGGEMHINRRELSRHSGVPYSVVKRHCKRDFLTTNMQRVADEFGAAVDHQCSPELLSIRFLSCAKKHSIWLQIELAGHFYLLQKLLADRLHEAITSRWVNVRPANIEALYLVFCLKMFSMLLVWAKYGCREAELSQYRSRLAALIKACDTGQTIVAVYS